MADEIKISVKYRFSGLSDDIGAGEEDFKIKKGSTLEDLVDMIEDKYKSKNIKLNNLFYIAYIVRQNPPGNQIYPLGKKKEAKLNDGDEISFMIMPAGG